MLRDKKPFPGIGTRLLLSLSIASTVAVALWLVEKLVKTKD